MATSASSTSSRGFIWDASNGMRLITTAVSTAVSINTGGFVTGDYRPPTAQNARHAYIWSEAGGIRDLGTLVPPANDGNPFNETFSNGAFINDNGHIAGTSAINNFDNRNHAFLYDGTTMKDLGSLGPDDFYSDRSSASCVNINDQVVGSSYRPYAGGGLYQIAFVYRDGAMFDLEKLVDSSGADYRFYTGVSINDAGQILVDAIYVPTNQRRAVVLTPFVPTGVASRMVHQNGIAYSINLPLAGRAGIESRSGGAAGNYEIVVTFPDVVTVNDASVVPSEGGTAAIVAPPAISADGKTVTIRLTNVSNAQTLTVTLSKVNGGGDLAIPMSVLVGDINGDGAVNSGDAIQARNRSGQACDYNTFRNDVNADGNINSGDSLVVRKNSGSSIAQ